MNRYREATGTRRSNDGTKRDRAVVLKLNDAELEALRSRASGRGLSVQRFLAESAMKGETWERESVVAGVGVKELSVLQNAIGRVGNNVNQAVVVAHRTGDAGGVEAMRDQVADVMRKVEDFIDGMQRRR